jgi:tellurite resistance protein
MSKMNILTILFSRKQISPDIEVDDSSIDDDGMLPEESYDPDFVLAGMRIGLAYKDQFGARTTRVVRLKRMDPNEFATFIHAFCELRGEDRTFQTDRILGLYDPVTGETLGEPDSFFGPYIDRALAEQERGLEKSRFYAAWHVIEALRDELSILVLIARADGRFVEREQAMLLQYATARAQELGLSFSDDESVVLLNWIKTQDPSEPQARAAIRNLAAHDGTLARIWDVSELIAEADGQVSDIERATFQQVRSAIAAIAQN